MDIILQIALAIFGAIIIYTIIGFIPGTDETSVLMPITLALVLSGVQPIVVLAFFIASFITLGVTNAIPTALVGLPGGVMASPMMESSLYLKSKGKSATAIKKMATGSLIGVLVALPISLLVANLIAPYGEMLKQYSQLLFVFGAIFLALLSKAKLLSIFSIIPLSLIFMSLRHLYWSMEVLPKDKNITVSFFLGITIGPLIIALLEMLNGNKRKEMIVENNNQVTIPKEKDKTLNPLKIVEKSEIKKPIIASIISQFLFVLSPVGLTILFGESLNKNEKDPEKRAKSTIVTMSSLIQATYISGIIIPLIALGIPISPVAIGPGVALFNAEPVFTLENNIHHLVPRGEMTVVILVAALVAIFVSYFLTNRFASTITKFVLTKIPHEAILGLFVAFIVLLAYMDAGLINIFGVILIGTVSGYLNRLGVNYGVQFMSLYAAPWIITQLIG